MKQPATCHYLNRSREKNQATHELGQLGGLKGGAARAKMGLDAKALTTWAALDELDLTEVMEDDFEPVD